MTPLTGRCRSCDTRVELRDIVAGADGRCPQCAVPFSEAWTVLLVEECAAVQNLTEALVRSLRRLTGLPGNLEVQPEELLANLTNEVPWRQSIDTEPAAVASEIRQLAARLDKSPAGPPPLFAGDLRAVAARLIGLATMLDSNQEAVDPTQTGAGGPARDAARILTDAADTIDRGLPDLVALRRDLQQAADAT
jgi:hypothetical protein